MARLDTGEPTARSGEVDPPEERMTVREDVRLTGPGPPEKAMDKRPDPIGARGRMEAARRTVRYTPSARREADQLV